jgi:hypothetical protein
MHYLNDMHGLHHMYYSYYMHFQIDCRLFYAVFDGSKQIWKTVATTMIRA